MSLREVERRIGISRVRKIVMSWDGGEDTLSVAQGWFVAGTCNAPMTMGLYQRIQGWIYECAQLNKARMSLPRISVSWPR